LESLNERYNPQELEQQLFGELIAAEQDMETVLTQIHEVLTNASDRDAAERQVLESLAPRYESASRRFSEDLRRWLAHNPAKGE
jgi:hypothetical protein